MCVCRGVCVWSWVCVCLGGVGLSVCVFGLQMPVCTCVCVCDREIPVFSLAGMVSYSLRLTSVNWM